MKRELKTKMAFARLKPSIYRAFKKIAEKQGYSVSELIRMMIEEAIRKDKKEVL